jgi:hypothetical protein
MSQPAAILEKALDFAFRSHKLQIIMKIQFSFCRAAVFALALFCAARSAPAHERDTFQIGDKYYVLTVGSLNEPFVVDNISGVDLRVAQIAAPGGNGAGHSATKGTPVTGLDRTLKVELAAGDKKATVSFDPSHEAPGSYAANFIPTVQTTYTYRIFGTIDSKPVDLTFSCVTGEVSESAEDNSVAKVSEGVTRLSKVGAFGCPAPRKAMGFPEPALSSYELNQHSQNLAAAAEKASSQAATAQALSIAGIVAGLFGLAVAMVSWKRK